MESAPLSLPERNCTVTRSPTFRPVTPGPTLAMTPDGSTPGVSGRLTRRAYFPALTTVSRVRLTDTAWTLISTSPCPGSGVGTSSSFITLGGPNSRTTIAFKGSLPDNSNSLLLAGDKAAAARGGQAQACVDS